MCKIISDFLCNTDSYTTMKEGIREIINAFTRQILFVLFWKSRENLPNPNMNNINRTDQMTNHGKPAPQSLDNENSCQATIQMHIL